MYQRLLVYFEAAGDRQRTDTLSMWHQNKAFGKIGPFDHLYNSIAHRQDGLDEAFLVAAIDHDGLDLGAKFHEPPHQRYATSLILDIGSRVFHCEQTPIGVNSDVTLTADDLLGSIVASFTLRHVAFDGRSIDDDKSWPGLSP